MAYELATPQAQQVLERRRREGEITLPILDHADRLLDPEREDVIRRSETADKRWFQGQFNVSRLRHESQ